MDKGPNFTNYITIENSFRNYLSGEGFNIFEIDGDGNCLFRTVAHQIEGNEDNYRHLRALTVGHIRENKTQFENYIYDDFTKIIFKIWLVINNGEDMWSLWP